MSSRYAVVCATCRYQNFHSSRWEANIDVAAHLRDNPTHSATVVEESQAATTRRVNELELLLSSRPADPRTGRNDRSGS
jgi:hypothetical protein